MEVIKGWKRQFFEVKAIGPTPKETPPPWKQYRPPEIKAVDENGKVIKSGQEKS